MVKVAALIAAAGQGKRMGAGRNKQFLSLGDRPVLAWTLQAFEDCPLVEQVTVIAGPGEEDYCREEIIGKYHFHKAKEVVTGGPERQDSIYNGLRALSCHPETIVIHDGARPLVTRELIEGSILAARRFGAALVAVKAKDTVKMGNTEDFIVQTLNRSLLWQAQTPQAFSYPLILQAYEEARVKGMAGTDDAALVEAMGRPVKLVAGNYENLKITTPEDLLFAEAILRRRGFL